MNAIRFHRWLVNIGSGLGVMAWYCQTTNHYLNQCWHSSLRHTCVIRIRWVNLLSFIRINTCFRNTTTAWFSMTRLNPPLMPHICISEVGHHWFRQWLVACSAPSHCLNQCWLIINWALRNKLHWNSNKIRTFSFMKMRLKMSSVKWRPFCPWGDYTHHRNMAQGFRRRVNGSKIRS